LQARELVWHQAIGVYDRITWGFVRYILGYRRSMAPQVRVLITGHAAEAEVIVLRGRRAAPRHLAGVPVTRPTGVLSG
jgi:hypothetical protein